MNFLKKAGVPLNIKKSDGISLLSSKGLPVELLNSKHYLDFLGYSVSADNVSIKKSSILKIKKEISYLLYRNLIQPLKGDTLKSIRIPANNRDYGFLVAIVQIRRYLYGNLSEIQIRNYLLGRANRLTFKGVMSYYPLLNNEQQLKELDGWLISVIYRILKLRARLLMRWKYNVQAQFPFNVSRDTLVATCKNEKIKNKKLLQIPSFFRIYLALKKGLTSHGIERTMNPETGYYE